MEKIEVIVKAMHDKLGENIVGLDMAGKSALFDTFVICSGNNERLIHAIKDNVEDKMAEHGYPVKKTEGILNSHWVLMDFGDVIVHIFDEQERELFNLEKLWSDAPKIEIEKYLK